MHGKKTEGPVWLVRGLNWQNGKKPWRQKPAVPANPFPCLHLTHIFKKNQQNVI